MTSRRAIAALTALVLAFFAAFTVQSGLPIAYWGGALAVLILLTAAVVTAGDLAADTVRYLISRCQSQSRTGTRP